MKQIKKDLPRIGLKPIKQHILAIDQGTTGSRAFIFDAQGQVIASSYQELKQYYPKPGWVEHDPEEIWAGVEAVTKKALREGGIDPRLIAAIGITNQRETTVLWDRKTGRPVHRAIVWQCRRTIDYCKKLKKYEAMINKKTGLVVDAYFSATKIQWLLDHVKGLRKRALKGEIAFGTIDSWLIYQLTQGASHVTDMTNASRTMIYDIKAKNWDTSLLRLMDIPEAILPKVQASASSFGHTAQGIAGLPGGIEISAVMGDQQAALYGQGCFTPGTIKATYGTGCFILTNTGDRCVYSKKGLLSTLACDAMGKPVYALEGSVFIAGAVMQWLRDELKLIKDAALSEDKIASIKESLGVYIVPAFVGLGAPYWKSDARGIITGLTRGVTDAHIIRAALESIAYQARDIFDLMSQESKLKIKSMAVDGGASRNNFLMQFQADILRIKILRPKLIDSTVAGAAYLAGVSCGLWQTGDLEHLHPMERQFNPIMPKKEVDRKYQGWCKAVGQALL